ncbi:hypothetical protein SHKM778_11490 [Streptomyces sp. KM77-8]|uniref:Uncharacterized protein n=1 Tax=Streptomyces haneummycinicus TaxID=3074435 RepID=A0AAT9HBJ3_9ACTN
MPGVPDPPDGSGLDSTPSQYVPIREEPPAAFSRTCRRSPFSFPPSRQARQDAASCFQPRPDRAVFFPVSVSFSPGAPDPPVSVPLSAVPAAPSGRSPRGHPARRAALRGR